MSLIWNENTQTNAQGNIGHTIHILLPTPGGRHSLGHSICAENQTRVILGWEVYLFHLSYYSTCLWGSLNAFSLWLDLKVLSVRNWQKREPWEEKKLGCNGRSVIYWVNTQESCQGSIHDLNLKTLNWSTSFIFPSAPFEKLHICLPPSWLTNNTCALCKYAWNETSPIPTCVILEDYQFMVTWQWCSYLFWWYVVFNVSGLNERWC